MLVQWSSSSLWMTRSYAVATGAVLCIPVWVLCVSVCVFELRLVHCYGKDHLRPLEQRESRTPPIRHGHLQQ